MVEWWQKCLDIWGEGKGEGGHLRRTEAIRKLRCLTIICSCQFLGKIGENIIGIFVCSCYVCLLVFLRGVLVEVCPGLPPMRPVLRMSRFCEIKRLICSIILHWMSVCHSLPLFFRCYLLLPHLTLSNQFKVLGIN